MKKTPHPILNLKDLGIGLAQSLKSFIIRLKPVQGIVFFVIMNALPISGWAQAAASWNYSTQSGNLGATYSWIDCSSGSAIITGDDTQASISWPFGFIFYNNTYTTANSLSIATNGFIRLDGVANGADYNGAGTYNLTSNASSFGQIIAAAIYDAYVGRLSSSWVKYLVTGSAPNRILTIEYNNLEIAYSDGLYANVQVSFYETLNKIVLKLGTDNIAVSGVDMGIHSGVNSYFNKWQEVQSGTNNTWIEYSPLVEVNATMGKTLFYYGTLKGAFDKINDGTHKGDITIKVNVSTTETASATLNASGSGSASYTSVNIYPTATGLSISGNLSAPLINLNGADNVTLDGRVNASGSTKDLILENTSNNASASTIRFLLSAENNTVKYCTIKGSETGSGSGTIVFASATSGNGNDNNIIDNNNITSSAAGRTYNVIYSSGAAGRENSLNTISNNNIFDFINASSSSNGINIGVNSIDWTVSGNSFYETTTVAPTAAYSYFVIYTTASTTGHLISGNYIGGSAPQCGGSAFTVNSSFTHYFNGMNINGGTSSPVTMQNNIIKNFNYTSTSTNPWDGLYLASNKIDAIGNTIGATTGTGSIVVTTPGSVTTNYSTTHAIRDLSTGTVTISNNNIGSITTIGSNTYSHCLEAIVISGVAPTITITNNLIGSLTTANSLQASSAAAASTLKQDLRGIYINSIITASTITGNTIANLTNAYTGSSVSKLDGICTSGGSNTIQNNTIRDLTTAAFSITVKGIQQTVVTVGTNQTVTGNTIYNLSNTNASASMVALGIDFSCATSGTNVVSGNFIHSLAVSSTNVASEIDGIRLSGGVVTCANNIINIGVSLTLGYKLYGIFENSSASAVNVNNIYFNTIYMGGTVASGTTSSTAALWNSNNTNIRNIRNNVLMNARSGGSTGKHYAIRVGGTTGLTIDYNDYYVSSGVLGYLAADKTTLALWQTATGQDANSLNIIPAFANAGGTSVTDYYCSASLPGVFGTGITADYNSLTRSSTPKMGALESNDYVWQGSISTNFATAGNWVGGTVPNDGADIIFAANPDRSCVLDQNRTLKNITNAQATDKLNTNGHQLTITGDLIFSNGAQIDATASSSILVFAGSLAQSIPAGAFVSNTIDGLTINNSNGVTLNADLIVTSSLALASGVFTLGANTLTLNGSIITSAGSLLGGSSTNISIGGSGASTTLPAVTLNNLALNRTNGISLGGDVSISGTLALNNGTLVLGSNRLTISGNSPTRTSGFIDASNDGATLAFTNTAAITLPTSIFSASVNNLTINGIGGITASSDFTINGVLNLQSANPSATKGLLDMWDGSALKSINMGDDAITIGVGDVTGIVIRTSAFVANKPYTFGNQFNIIIFNPGGTYPTQIKSKTTIGVSPSWKPEAIMRTNDYIRTGGSACFFTFINHYLDAELNGNTEERMVRWKLTPPSTVAEVGRSEINTTDNWLANANISVANLPTVFGSERTLANSELIALVWNGSVSNVWVTQENWTPRSSPSSVSNVIIPDASTTPNDPMVLGTTEIKSLTIEAGGILNSEEAAQLTINGGSGSWSNNGGAFHDSTGTVIFTNAAATISGVTNFYNVTINSGAGLTMGSGGTMRIGGTMINTGTWIVAAVTHNVVEYNGGSQTVLNPNGLPSGYQNLILSGSGTKTMPGTALSILGDFTILGTASVTSASSLTIGGELEIQEGATFATGAFNHMVGGHFDNAGTFTATPGTTLTLNGTAVQNIYGGSVMNFENLIIDNSTGVNIFSDITVNDALTLTAGTLSVGATVLTLNGSLTKTAGFMDVNTLSSLHFGGTAALTIPATLFATTPSINNLTINRTGGITFSSDLTVNGLLTLQSTNPSSTVGSLSMGSYTLDMGGSSTTVGPGDVTGIVRRTSFVPNVEYSFGNQFTTITYPNVGTLPTEMSVKIYIGAAPSWKTIGINRFYDVIQTGGSGTQAVLKAHYLDSELNGNLESKIVDWSYRYATTTLTEHGRSNYNTTDNWISLSNANVAFFSSSFGTVELTLSGSELTSLTWNGSVSTSWVTAENWTPNGAPSDNTIIIIPDAATTPDDPVIPATASCGTLAIENGGILNSSTNAQLTLNGASGVWSNQGGTFNAANSTIIFTNAAGIINGTTKFNNITVSSSASLTLGTGSITRIAGTLTNNGIVDAGLFNSTMEYNGTDQTVLNLNGITNPGYNNLILSGSGTKTMPGTPMNVFGGLTVSGTSTATAAEALTVLGNITIESGANFATGAYNHSIGGNFDNNGTFTASSGKTITLNGASAQSILGTSAISFENLTIDNAFEVTLSRNISVNDVLTLTTGNLVVGTTTLSINGGLIRINGQINVGPLSSLIFGGTVAVTLPNNLFSATPSINNLTLNRSGGVTLGNQNMTVEGLLSLVSGTLNVALNTLTINGSSPTRTTGTIDASQTGATLAFTNAAAITLPTSIFSGSVTNMTIIGTGGVTSNGDITLTGIINLLSANPTATKGALDMGSNTFNIGESAHFVGIGDVIGIVKREHTFNNNQEYCFGNEYTRLTFLNVPSSTKPTWVSCKIEIGTAPVWRSVAIKRVYSFAQSGGTDRAWLKLHYLDSELNGSETDETKITFWNDYDGLATGSNTYVNGKTTFDATDNWIGLVGMAINFIAPATTFAKQYGLGYTNVSVITWTGLGSASYPGDWSLPGHWSGGVPSAGDDVLIPAGLSTTYPYRNLLPGYAPAVAKTLKIESGATLTMNDYDLTIYGATDAWVNNGTFTSTDGTVYFANGSTSNIATISGTTNFNNIRVLANTYIQPTAGSIIRIAGGLVADATSILDFTANANTIEYNGADQTIINPISSIPGYYNLILSGSGTKTLPALSIANDLSTAGTVTASVTGIQTISGSLNVGTGTIFNAGNYNHSIEGNITNDGTFTANGSTITLNGSSSQSINNGNAIVFHDLIIDNTAGVIMQQSTEVSHTITLTNGFIDLNSNILTISNNAASAISRTNGFILSEQTDNTSKLKWNIGNTIDTYTFPFGTVLAEYIPFVLNHTSGNIGNVTVSTYHTAANNTPFPASVTNVDKDSLDNSANVVDRFWQIDKDGPTGTATLTFTISDLELGSSSDLVAQRWNTTDSKWDQPLPNQSNTSNSATVPNVTNFSPWTMSGSSSPLPVSLMNFTVTNSANYAKLKWETASETNNLGFDVEKSQNLNQWSKVGFIAGAGNSSQIMKYFYNDLLTDDIAKEIEVVYYRLKQTDFDGVKTYSDTRSITLNLINQNKSVSFKVFPNPAFEYLNINSNSSVKQFLGELYNHSGVLIKNFTVDGSIQLDISDCRPGGYIIIITNTVSGEKYRYTIIKCN